MCHPVYKPGIDCSETQRMFLCQRFCTLLHFLSAMPVSKPENTAKAQALSFSGSSLPPLFSPHGGRFQLPLHIARPLHLPALFRFFSPISETFLSDLLIPIPVVLLDAYFETVPCNCVLLNNVQGAYLAARHLIRTCKTQPGYLHSAYPISNFAERSSGFYKAVRAAGMSSSRSIVHKLTPSMEGAYA